MKILSDSKKLLLELLLKDTRISSEILLNGEIPESIKVHDDGSVTFIEVDSIGGVGCFRIKNLRVSGVEYNDACSL